MKYYAVIDTNILVSYMWVEKSNPGTIIKFVFDDIIVPLLNEEILSEYYEVLTRNKFGFKKDIVDSVISKIKSKAIFL